MDIEYDQNKLNKLVKKVTKKYSQDGRSVQPKFAFFSERNVYKALRTVNFSPSWDSRHIRSLSQMIHGFTVGITVKEFPALPVYTEHL